MCLLSMIEMLKNIIYSCGPHINTLTTTDMVSRRRILSRSRDDLNLDVVPGFGNQEEEEDVWYQKEKLYKCPVLMQYPYVITLAESRFCIRFNTRYFVHRHV
ncbi:hypothetical protein M8J75_012572 [Diaphorina citri]|nr:hypothetical protein M8J75_012572 [Diaphorina citri]